MLLNHESGPQKTSELVSSVKKNKTLCRSNTPWSLSHFRKKQSTSQQFIFLIIWCQSRFSPLHHTLLNVDVNCLNLTNLPNLSCLNYFPLREKEKSCTSLMAKDFNFWISRFSLSLLQARSALFNLGNTVNALSCYSSFSFTMKCWPCTRCLSSLNQI